VLTLTTTYAPLSGGLQAVHYTVLSTDTLTTVASGLASAVNANSGLTGVGLSGVAITPTTLSTAQTFTASKLLPSGSSNTTVTAVDGSNNSIANNYQFGITGAPSTSLKYDLNGNMTNDGTNTYQWDAENRLIQINYPESQDLSASAFAHNIAQADTAAMSKGYSLASVDDLFFDSVLGTSRIKCPSRTTTIAVPVCCAISLAR
jgi:hypothetical protein